MNFVTAKILFSLQKVLRSTTKINHMYFSFCRFCSSLWNLHREIKAIQALCHGWSKTVWDDIYSWFKLRDSVHHSEEYDKWAGPYESRLARAIVLVSLTCEYFLIFKLNLPVKRSFVTLSHCNILSFCKPTFCFCSVHEAFELY